jgi:hypothetical protein
MLCGDKYRLATSSRRSTSERSTIQRPALRIRALTFSTLPDLPTSRL